MTAGRRRDRAAVQQSTDQAAGGKAERCGGGSQDGPAAAYRPPDALRWAQMRPADTQELTAWQHLVAIHILAPQPGLWPFDG